MRKAAFAAAILGSLALGGCYSDQERQVAACALESQAFYKNSSDPLAPIHEGGRTVTCMQAHGYEYMPAEARKDPRCPESKADVDPWLNSDMEWCYRPMGWGARQVYRIEQLLGR